MPIKDINNNLKVFSIPRENKKKSLEFYDGDSSSHS